MAALIAMMAVPTVLPAVQRKDAIKHAQVWTATNIPSMDIKAGPRPPLAELSGSTVNCKYIDKRLGGRSPKFACLLGEEELKVKFGGNNGEVYGEVAATRLLWALGFGADQMYPVRVICTGCPSAFGGIVQTSGDRIFDPAAIEWKMPGMELSDWSWRELDTVDESAGGAPKAQRDGLKLMAVFLQHTDSKAQQQRLICVDDGPVTNSAECQHPFMLIQDAGLTFGKANTFNANPVGAMNLTAWSSTPVWKPGSDKCLGNLPKSYTGSLDDPLISEEGRQFLSDLLGQLSDAQISDLFTVARVTLRARKPDDPRSGLATVDEWVAAFKAKRAEIAERRCA
jgi:hypothetical protein